MPDVARSSLRAGLVETVDALTDLPKVFRAWLASQPGVRRLIAKLERQMRAGKLSREDVIHLVKRWSEGLPPRHGIVMRLTDFAQREFPFDPGLAPASKRRTRRRGRGKGGAHGEKE